MVEQDLVDQESTLWVETVVAYLVNSTIFVFVALFQLLGKLPIFLQSLFESLIVTFIVVYQHFEDSVQSLFSEFQIRLLQVFFGILTIHIVAICIAWRVYSDRITDRFLRPSHLISHEQLKTSVSELKLPAEHTPRW